MEKLYTKGVKYVYRYGVNTVVSTTGASVLDAYGQHVKPGDDLKRTQQKIGAEVRRHSDDFEWHDDGSLSVTHVVPSKQATPNNQRLLGRKLTWGSDCG